MNNDRLAISNFTTIHYDGEIRGMLTKDPNDGQWTALLGSSVIGPMTARRDLLEAVDAHLSR